MRKIDTISKKTIVSEVVQYGGQQKSEALLVKDLEFDDVAAWKLINAAIFKLIMVSKDCHGRFTANYPKFLSSR